MRVEGRGEDYGVIHLRSEEGEELALFLVRETGLPVADIEKLIWLGAVYFNGLRVRSSDVVVQPGDLVRVHSQPRRFAVAQFSPAILRETSDFLIVNKPAGLPVHALTDNLRDHLIALLEERLGFQLYITHRLDIETSGLLVLAKTPEAQREINRQIAEKKVRRVYRAFVRGAVAVGEYVHYMEPSPKAPKRLVDEAREGWLRCSLRVTECREVETGLVESVFGFSCEGRVFEVRVELGTGRSQQIRAQLGFLGVPILGDILYGSTDRGGPRKIALQAFALEMDGAWNWVK